MAGLIKTVLMLEHGELVPTLHFNAPNPLLDMDATPFRVCTEAGALAAAAACRSRRSARSAWAAPMPMSSSKVRRGGRRSGSARQPACSACQRPRRAGSAGLCSDLAEHLQSADDVRLADVSRTLADRRQFDVRVSIVADDPREAARLLRAGREPATTGQLTKVVFLFPGQGTLGHAAGAAPHQLLSGFRAYFDEISDVIRSRHQIDLSPVVAGPSRPLTGSRTRCTSNSGCSHSAMRWAAS